MEARAGRVLCVVRGQPEGRATATRAIEIALEKKAHLTFAMILDVDFLARAGPTLRPIRLIYQRLEEMAEFSMLILHDRAQRRGVESVDWVIRKGTAAEQLRALAKELSVDTLVIGRPIPGKKGSVFTPKEFDRFIAKLQEETDLNIIQVHSESEGLPREGDR